jgi:hypothetical protein
MPGKWDITGKKIDSLILPEVLKRPDAFRGSAFD